MTDQRTQTRRVIILGSTGSIGTSTIEVIEHLNRSGHASFDVVGLAAGRRADVLIAQARVLGVERIAIADEQAASNCRGFARCFAGPDAAQELIDAVAQPGDIVVGAMVGVAGLPATLLAIERGCDIALANKETLVAAGALVMPAVRKHGLQLLPVDSEHSAIFQCLTGARAEQEVRKLVITASGGPFRTWDAQRTAEATVNEALNHPTWDMGPKVTIDSASMMNKALEVIEAHWLFDLPGDRIDVLVHPQSIVHSFVEFMDGSVLAQLGAPDMRTPIQVALTWPRRYDGCSQPLDFASMRSLDFDRVDHDRFGAVRLAGDVVAMGGTAGAVFNAANEVAVAAFMERRVPFGQITETVRATVDQTPIEPVQSIECVLRADARARKTAKHMIERCAADVSAG